MAQLFRNNAFSNLGASLTNVATTLTVTSGHGDRFPVVTAPDFCLLTLQDASNNIEIVKVTARTSGSDSMTIQRAQEGTTARAWNLGDVVELRLTASALNPLSLMEGASTAATVRAAIDAAASSHTHTASQISDSTAVGRAVLTAADQAAARSAIGAPATDGTGATGTWGVSVTGNAATATKLQTARTINGTSFDGSANITTANWGTARTLTIGNTGKSFDGSANVSWSLEEIGAARFGSLAVGTDLNTVVAPGFYRLQINHVNVPGGVDYGQLTVARGGGDTILQIVTGYNSGEIYWRQGNPPDVGGTGSWSAWHRFFHSGNLGAASETAAGLVELATAAEAQAGTDGTRALSPLRLRDALNASGSAPIYACRAWVNFNGTGTVAIRASRNVSSITDNGVGSYTVNFTTAMPDVNYSAVFGGDGQAAVNITAVGVRAFNTTSCQIDVGSVGAGAAIPSDRTTICAAFFH